MEMIDDGRIAQVFFENIPPGLITDTTELVENRCRMLARI